MDDILVLIMDNTTILAPTYLTAYFDSSSKTSCLIINKSEILDKIWVSLPKDVGHQLSLANIYNYADRSVVDYTSETCQRKGHKPWLCIDVSILDMNVGYHKYVLEFVNRYTDDVILMYIDYHIQDSNVEKNYVYMKRNER